MKKCELENGTVYYVFKDEIAVWKLKDGKRKLICLNMQGVNDSEIMQNKELAHWIYKMALREVGIRDGDGHIVGIDKDALSDEDLWLASLWGKIMDKEIPPLPDDDDEYGHEFRAKLSPDKMAEFRKYVMGREDLSESQKREILESVDESDDEE